MKKSHQKHKTIGVSFNPLLRQRAGLRAHQLGLSFSRYVSLCVEAEIAGESQLPAHPRRKLPPETMAMMLADWDSSAAKERLQLDISRVLAAGDIAFFPQLRLGVGVADFLVEFCLCRSCRKATAETLANAAEPNTAGQQADAGKAGGVTAKAGRRRQPCRGKGGGRSSAAGVLRIVLECCHPVVGEYAVLLGRAIILQQVATVDAVLLCVPYLSLLEPELQQALARQQISIVTPDTLLSALYQQLAAIGETKATRA